MGLFRKKEKPAAMTAEELLGLSNIDLRDAVSDAMMKEAGRREVRQCLELFSGPKRTFYILSLYEAEVSTGGLCRFLVGPGRVTAEYVVDELKRIHASRHAELLKKFFASNGIDPADLRDLEISNSWEFEERKKMYPFEQFDESFEKLYSKESVEGRLLSYVRSNITDFI